ncbi:hypothetical protein AMTRI_Chr09g14770 [Amborella trichopoda]
MHILEDKALSLSSSLHKLCLYTDALSTALLPSPLSLSPIHCISFVYVTKLSHPLFSLRPSLSLPWSILSTEGVFYRGYLLALDCPNHR